MVYIIVFLAFILTWFFIEITLFLANKNFKSTYIAGIISYNKFIKNLRIIGILLFMFTTAYMYNFQNDKFLEAIEYCLGIIK